jgi:flagellar transcriptional activator FlhC
MKQRSIVSEARQVGLAIELIQLGARLQVLEAEIGLSRERLLRLYKEVKGESPPKGMLPFSTDWFLGWQPNIHASLFVQVHRFIAQATGERGIGVAIKSYRLYLEHVAQQRLEPLLSFTRAWTLLRFFESKLLQTAPCVRCMGNYVVHTLELHDHFVCGLCAPPSRAGTAGRAPGQATARAVAA